MWLNQATTTISKIGRINKPKLYSNFITEISVQHDHALVNNI